MSRLTINTTEAQSFDAVDQADLYTMIVDEISESNTSEAGNEYVWVHFKFEDPNLQRRCGRARRAYPISGSGAGFFREFWKVTTGQEIPMDTEIDVDPDDAIGVRVLAQVTPGEFEGRPQNEIGALTPAS